MIRAAYALSIALVLLGGASIAAGVPDIHFEQGWTEVIAGSVAGSAGCVVFVLAAILGRLDALRAAMEALPRAAETRAAVDAALPEVAAVASPPEDVDVLPRAGEDGVPDALETPILAPADPEPAPEARPIPALAFPVEGARASDEIAVGPPPILPPTNPDAAAEPAAKRPNFLASFLSRRAAQRERDISRVFEPQSEKPRAPEPEPVEPGGLDGFDLPHGGGELLRPTYDHDPDPAPEEDAPHADVDPNAGLAHEDHREEVEPASEEVPDAGQEPAEVAAPVVDHPLRPSVVGRYAAGSASYVLYSNGMIEVETEAGTHQFASMAELKAFIESQEAARV